MWLNCPCLLCAYKHIVHLWNHKAHKICDNRSSIVSSESGCYLHHFVYKALVAYNGNSIWRSLKKEWRKKTNVDDENERVHTQKLIKKLPKEDINDSFFYLKCFHLFPSYCYSILASTISHRKRLLPHFHTSQKIVP